MTNFSSPTTRSPWQRVADIGEHPLHLVEGAVVGNGVGLIFEVGPKNKVGSDYFRAFLDSGLLGATTEPVISGLINRGPYPGYNWVEVTDSTDVVPLTNGEHVQVPEGIQLRIVEALASLVPPGGHLMMEYDSEHRVMTSRALAATVPPVATPLGAMMFAAGCGVAFTDWYISEGGREGPRKLQGFKALDAAHERRRGLEMLANLEAFMSRSKDVDWDIQMVVRPLAAAAIVVLRERLGVAEGPFTA